MGGFPSGQPTYRIRGGAATRIGTQLLGLVVTVLALGVRAPFAVVLVRHRHAKHTMLA
ncbi:hypothetical protein [Arthrobacter sp. H41]|uniref:hypothetical protein n=1 Tax=Arthrobacter sp. H41 TaxID=1312978 RepID=UPI0004B49BB8|nr:hypothetical protein [Arthrobacter sp. H41]